MLSAIRGAVRHRAVSRLLHALLVLALVYVFTFLMLSVLPGDPISNRLRDPENSYTEAEISALLAYYRVDQPVWVRFLDAFSKLLLGDLGLSLTSSRPVIDEILAVLPSTLELTLIAFGLGAVLAIAITLAAIYLPKDRGGELFRSLPAVFQSVPTFLTGLVLIQVFSFRLGWFQILRDEGIISAILPATALAIPIAAPLAQVLIANIDGVRQAPFTRVALAKGLSQPRIFTTHLIRPAALPTVTVFGLLFGELVGGSLITEAVFGRVGIGTLVMRSVAERDMPLLQGIAILAAISYVVINLVVDTLYPVLDPRLRTVQAPARRTAGSTATRVKESTS